MNMKNKIREFFTLTRKGKGGFTLVELIVVIAILGILAGVAVPVYNGYIKKADRAGDEQLLAAINKAFVSACLANGEDNYDLEERPSITITDGVVSADALNTNNDSIDATFATLFEGGKFKVITSVVYDEAFGGFKDPATADELTLSYGGGTITISREVIQAMQNSTFGSVMGGEALLGEIAGLTNMVNESGSQLAEDLLADEIYLKRYAAYLGIEDEDIPEGREALENAIGEKLAEHFVANGIDISGENSGELFDAALVNGMVFYAAEGMKDYDVDRANTLLNSDNIYSQLSTEPSTRLAQASLVYGIYSGFVNSEFNTGDAEGNKAASSTDDPMSAIQAISGSGAHSANFQAYLDSEQGQADVKAYMEAMDVINETSGKGAGAGVLVNGFEDSELADLLTQVLGK